jgi:hypothetical protein
MTVVIFVKSFGKIIYTWGEKVARKPCDQSPSSMLKLSQGDFTRALQCP